MPEGSRKEEANTFHRCRQQKIKLSAETNQLETKRTVQ